MPREESKLESASVHRFWGYDRLWFWLVAAIAPLIVYHRVLLGEGNQAAHFWGDTTNAYWPDLAFFTRSIAQGEIPLWNPNDRGGFPFAFDPQPGVLYPLNWLFVIIGLVMGRVPYELFQLKILVHLSIASLGWAVWMSKRVCKPAALVGAFGATFGCYTLQHAHYGLIWPIAYVPWFLTALDRWVATRSRSSTLAMGACVGAIVAAGSPPAAMYGLLVCAFFGLTKALPTLLRSTGLERRERLATILLGVALAVALVTPVVIGAAHLTSASILEKRDFNYISSGSLAWGDLKAFLYPSASGAIVYLGAALVGLACVGIVCRFFQPLTLIAVALGALGVLLAVGVNTPVLSWFVTVFAPGRYFRLVFRYLYLTQIALGVLAALGTDTLLSTRRRARAGRLLLMGTFAASALLWHLTRTAQEAPAVVRDMLAATCWFGGIAVTSLLCIQKQMLRWVAPGFSILVLADFSAYVPRSNVLRDGTFELPRNLTQARIAQLESDSIEYRIWDEFALGFRAGSRMNVRDLRGYMDPLRLATYEKMASQLIAAPELLGRWGVRWVLPADHPYVGGGHKRVNYGLLRSAIRRENHVFELPSPRASGFFTDFYEVRAEDASAWQALEASPRGARLQLPAKLASSHELPIQPDRDSAANPTRELRAQVIKRQNNSLNFSIDAPKAGWFVVNEAYFPGWKAWVDGASTPLYQVDGWIRGLPIAKGSHRIELKFRPVDWLIGASIAFLSWVTLGVLATRAGVNLWARLVSKRNR